MIVWSIMYTNRCQARKVNFPKEVEISDNDPSDMPKMENPSKIYQLKLWDSPITFIIIIHIKPTIGRPIKRRIAVDFTSVVWILDIIEITLLIELETCEVLFSLGESR